MAEAEGDAGEAGRCVRRAILRVALDRHASALLPGPVGVEPLGRWICYKRGEVDRSHLLEGLFANVGAFVAKVDARYPGALTCHAGCADCCLGGLSVTAVEAERIAALVATLDAAPRTRLRARAEAPTEDRCVALERDGRCAIYEARPVVCRSHGVPIRFRSSLADGEAEVRRLPLVDVCPRNFQEVELESVAADCVLDQATLSTALGQIDAIGAPEAERGRRLDLATLLARCAGSETADRRGNGGA